jgi:uncharacterized protein YbjT (DUF2867 family)
MYAIMGITGKVGGAVARTLLAKGEKVRGIVRNPEKAAEWQKQGVELFKAHYDDANALTAAFTDVGGVFVMVPPNFAPALFRNSPGGGDEFHRRQIRTNSRTQTLYGAEYQRT